MNMLKRTLAMLLALCMLFSAVPVTALADDGVLDVVGASVDSSADNKEAVLTSEVIVTDEDHTVDDALKQAEEPEAEEPEAEEPEAEEPEAEEPEAEEPEAEEPEADEPEAEETPKNPDTNDNISADQTTESTPVEDPYALMTLDLDDDLSVASINVTDKPSGTTVKGEPFDSKVSANHRIPGLVNHNGTLIASADARWDNEKDGGGIDLVVSRSSDGNTWNYTFAGYLADNGNVWNADSTTLMDPVIISDGSTLYLLADMYPAGYSISSSSTTNVFSDTAIGFDSNGNLLLSGDNRSTYGYYLKDGKIYATDGTEQAGYSVRDWYDLYQNDEYVTNLFFSDSPFQVRATSYICMTTSTDGGKTWNSPILVNVKPAGVSWLVLGPGSGIVTQDGNLAFTAYDGSNIYLVYGKNGNWNTVKNSAATNESSIVELPDGTIRAFVKRNGNNAIAYVDFIKSGSGYAAGSLVDTGVDNFSNCMVSSLLYSKTYGGKPVVLVCCPSMPDSGQWNGRKNGMIHMFTLDSSNNMSYVSAYAVNGTGDFFAYSDMAELSDGTIGLLYEDDCISYAAGNHYGEASHIAYKNVNLETALNVTFDVPVQDTILSDSATNVEVAVPNVDTNGWTLKVIPDETVAALDGADYVAYDVTITKADGANYEDPAEVTLPLGKMAGKSGIYPFVVEDDGTVRKIEKFTVGTETITFTAPHFSVQGVARDASAITETKNVEILVGEKTTITDKTGNYKASYTGEGLNEAIADVEVEGTTDEGSSVVTPLTSLTAGETNTFYIQVADKTYLTSSGGTTTNFMEAGLWYAYYAGASYCTIRSTTTTYYLSVGYDGVVTTTQGTSYMKMSNGQLVGYFSNLPAGTPVNASVTEAVNKTDITITGISAGTTSVVVGTTQYNITVKNEVRNIVLYTGQSKMDTIDNAGYTMANVTASPNNAVATIDKVEAKTVNAEKKLVAVSAIESGKQYLLVNNRAGKTLTSSRNDVGLWLNGTADADSTHLWTIEGSGDYYTVRYGTNGGYLNVGNGYASVTDSAVTLQLDYIEGRDHWLINDQQGYYGLNDYTGAATIAAGWGGAATDKGSWWTIYEVVDANSTTATEVTFTGVAAGNTTATVGRVIYNITVQDAPVAGEISDFNNIVGEDEYTDGNANADYRSDLDMDGKAITKLTISENVTFDLNVDIAGAESVTWSVANPAIATVNEAGEITGVAAGETTVTATVIKDGKVESISIPVIVKKSLLSAGQTPIDIFYYVEHIENTTPYYTMFLSSEGTDPVYKLVEAVEGEVIYLQRPDDTAWALIWTADPDADHALALMGSTGTINEYYPLHNANGTLGDGYVDANGNNRYDAGESEYYYTSATFTTNGAPNNAYKNVVLVGNDGGTSWLNAVKAMLDESLVLGCDGALSSTRWDHDGVPKIVTSMTFISDPMPKITKSVDGVLPATRKLADYRRYTEGMVAGVDELVYFKINVTLDRPTVWVDEAAGIGAIKFSESEVIDEELENAYLYTKELDQEDGDYDGEIAVEKRTQKSNITEWLNTPWAADEQSRTKEFYLVYMITDDDIPKFTIDNIANLNTHYQSKYSTGVSARAAKALASITVVGKAMDNIVIDFGQKVVYDGLTAEHLKYAKLGTFDTTYGTITVEGSSPKVEADGDEYYDEYVLTYIPTSILQGPDVIQLSGTYHENGQATTKVINGFAVYPATSVYYEEGFIFDNKTGSWDTTNAKKATLEQTLELLGKSVYENDALKGRVTDKKHEYGYDQIYDGNTTGSAGSYAKSTTVGDQTVFTFTGTGFQLYANSDSASGYVTVYSQGSLSKMYMINTKLTDITGNAINGTYYTLPIISETQLPYGTYTVYIKHTNAEAPIFIDGVRILNTVNDQTDGNGNIYYIDQEDKPAFYEIRDYVLNAVEVEKLEKSDYISNDNRVAMVSKVEDMSGQVYNALAVDDAAVVITDGTTFTKADAQNLLDNGPKNELYLYSGQTLIFNVSTERIMQLGLKAPTGSATFKLTVDNEELSLKKLTSTVDMFYQIAGKGTEHTVSITVNSGVLSVTLLKICDDPSAAFPALTQENIKDALLATYGLDEEKIPEEPETEPSKPETEPSEPETKPTEPSKPSKPGNEKPGKPGNEKPGKPGNEKPGNNRPGRPAEDNKKDEVKAVLNIVFINLRGRQVGTATLTETGNAKDRCVFSASEISAQAPARYRALWFTPAIVSYGDTARIIVPVI